MDNTTAQTRKDTELALALAKNRKWEDKFLKLKAIISMQQTVKREISTNVIEFIDESLEELKHG